MTQHVARPAPDAGGPRRTLALVRPVPVSLDEFLGADETAPLPPAPVATVATETSVAGPTVRIAIRLPGGDLILDAIVDARHIDATRIEQLRALLCEPAGLWLVGDDGER